MLYNNVGRWYAVYVWMCMSSNLKYSTSETEARKFARYSVYYKIAFYTILHGDL